MIKIRYLIPLFLLFILTACESDSPDDAPSRPKAVDKSGNLRGTGESTSDLLTNEDFDNIRIEIAYVRGFRPTQAAMEGFVAYLQERTSKERVDLVYRELESPEQDDLTLEEIDELESENRTVYNEGRTLGVYIYFSDAPAEDDQEEEGLVTLGAVYRNTSMIIHEITVRKLAAQRAQITAADVESSTINHEFGHLFGLVNLGITPINDHEGVVFGDDGEPLTDANDMPIGSNHCNVDGCLMNAELRFGGSSNRRAIITSKYQPGLEAVCRLSGKSVLHMLEAKTAKGNSLAPNLDAECLLDLRSNGGR